MRINIFLALILTYHNIPERNDRLRENQQRAQNQGLETDAAEWSLVIVTCIINALLISTFSAVMSKSLQ